jgi:hypothetical protein
MSTDKIWDAINITEEDKPIIYLILDTSTSLLLIIKKLNKIGWAYQMSNRTTRNFVHPILNNSNIANFFLLINISKV